MVEDRERSFGQPEQSEPNHQNPHEPNDQEDPEIPHASKLVQPAKHGFISRLFGFHNGPNPSEIPVPIENTSFQPHAFDATAPQDTDISVHSSLSSDNSHTLESTPHSTTDTTDSNNDLGTEEIRPADNEEENRIQSNHPVSIIRGMFSHIDTTSPEPEDYTRIRNTRMNRRAILKVAAGLAGGVLASQLPTFNGRATAQDTEVETPEEAEPTGTPPEHQEKAQPSEEPSIQSYEDIPTSQEQTPYQQPENTANFSLDSIGIKTTEYPGSPESKEYLREFENNVGWAYNCKPGASRETIYAHMKKMREAGCNSVYIGHNNPGDANPNKTEPGLSYAVYHALRTNENGLGEGGKQMLQAIVNGVEAARDMGMQVVLPVGYQIGMGPEWGRANSGELRRNRDGSEMRHWGAEPTASPYSEKYKQDIDTYYRWINDNILAKYDNIKALNLGDEPMGGDFSEHAMREFRNRYGVEYSQASNRQRGEFQAGVIPDYAIQSANKWKEINPNVLTSMTFHIQRDNNMFSYDVEKIFRETPDTFVFSADTHLHDNVPNAPITSGDVQGLHHLVKTLSLYSGAYQKGLMFWQGGNAWSFGYDGTCPEEGIHSPQQAAEVNWDIIHNVAKRAGARLKKVFGWSYTSPSDQILRTATPEEMFAKNNALMMPNRDTLSQHQDRTPQRVVVISRDHIYDKMGSEAYNGHLIDTSDIVNLQSYNLKEDIVVIPEGDRDFAAQYARQHGSQVESLGGKDLQSLPDRIINLPPDTKELEPGKAWFGEPPAYLTDAVRDLKQKYEAKGVNWVNQFGLFKGCMYFKGDDNNYWPYMVFERGVFHPVSNRFELSLTYRDMANGKVELGEGNRAFAGFPPQAQERLKTTPITGDQNSEAPSFTEFRKYMTVNGDNKDPDMRGQFADLSLDKDGNPSLKQDASTNEKFRYVHYDDGTGHNIPKVLFDEISRRFGNSEQEWWPEVGRPISNPYWVHSDIGGEMQWVLTQMFERGMMTYHPDYDGKSEPQWVTQGALTGNHFLKLFNDGKDEAYKSEYLEMFR